MKHTIHTLFKSTVEAVLPPLQKSQFDGKGVLTPEEFVAAGEYLVHACPTWSWEGGDPKKRRSYFPPDKQFLVTRNVPCMRRATELEGGYNPNSEFALQGEGEEGWVATHSDPRTRGAGGSGAGGSGEEHIPDIDDGAPGGGAGGGKGAAGGGGGDDDIPDITDLELNEGDDEAALPAHAPAASGAGTGASGARGPGYLRTEEPADNIVRTRTYDLYITYDQYYQVPRFWLVGFDESRRPLLPQQVMEDVSEEHARKTITVDPHPHLSGLSAASIHPCRHAEVMKKLVDNLLEAGRSFSVQQYLVLFLKFIASVVPTIQYDYTMSVGGE